MMNAMMPMMGELLGGLGTPPPGVGGPTGALRATSLCCLG